ncbi:MAG: cation transporter [Ahniella sp.]|nr:cation transporter [Ahniella sp.]
MRTTITTTRQAATTMARMPGTDTARPHDVHATVHDSAMGAFRWSLLFNIGLVIVEAGAGFWVDSVALLADAAHNLGDVLGLLLAYGAARLAQKKPDERHTYGYARSTILAAMVNAAILMFACGALTFESFDRLANPHRPDGWVMMAVASFAVLVNAGSAVLFWRSQKHDLNARGAFLHLAADAAVSVAVVFAGLLIVLGGPAWLDPAISLLVNAVILWSAVQLLRQALDLSLDAVPAHLSVNKIEAALRTIPGVRALHDLHVWPLSTTVAAMTAHIEHDGIRDGDELLADAQHIMLEKFQISHCTIQLENISCRQRCEDIPGP